MANKINLKVAMRLTEGARVKDFIYFYTTRIAGISTESSLSLDDCQVEHGDELMGEVTTYTLTKRKIYDWAGNSGRKYTLEKFVLTVDADNLGGQLNACVSGEGNYCMLSDIADDIMRYGAKGYITYKMETWVEPLDD